ncbi:MAG: hypothetical protein GKS00_08495 [Alphaproteobacteria bacterium]|nr:hypothetical protein [Alphaproteobacteria bacterium]
MAISTKVLVLALDAAEPALLLRWAAEGKLPNIARLMARGAYSKMETPPGLSGATWPTLQTGVNTARHGWYFYSQLRPGSYRTQLVSRSEIQVPEFWSTLSDAGKRVAILDIPKSYPTQGLNGIHVVDWGNHDLDIIDGFRTWPPELRGKLDQRYGHDPFNRHAFGARGPTDLSAFTDGLCKNIERKSGMVVDLLGQESWDMLFASWDDVHWAGHYGWRQHDPEHPHHDPKLAAKIGDPIERVLVTADRCIGNIVARAGPETTVMLLASHGMGPAYRTALLLDPILRRLESAQEGRRNAYWKLRGIWDSLPGQVHRPLAYVKDLVRETLLARDRARRRHFVMPCNNDGGGIRLNVIGREPEGKIQPGAEYDEHCRWLMESLSAVVDADTGEPILQQVVKIADHMAGPQLDNLPDLAMQWNVGPATKRITSPQIGEIEVDIPFWRNGEHLPHGFLLSTAPGVVPGPIDRTVRSEDFAPTVCELLGVPLSDIDGGVIKEMAPKALEDAA